MVCLRCLGKTYQACLDALSHLAVHLFWSDTEIENTMSETRKKLKSIRIKLRYCRWALSRVFKYNLGSEVLYQGKRYILYQGVCNPYWDMALITQEKPVIVKHVHVSNFRLVRRIENYMHNFKSSYRFRMNYWYEIDMQK